MTDTTLELSIGELAGDIMRCASGASPNLGCDVRCSSVAEFYGDNVPDEMPTRLDIDRLATSFEIFSR